MEWIQKVNDFERICTLKALLYYHIYNTRYITLDDLLEIEDIAENELEIEILEPIQKDNLNHTLSIWRSQVIKKFVELEFILYHKGDDE